MERAEQAEQAETGAQAAEYRKLPGVDALLQQPEVRLLAAEHGDGPLLAAARALLDEARTAIRAGGRAPAPEHWPQRIAARLERDAAPSLRQVINATGVIIHTNLGRAPLSRAALDAMQRVAAGYSTLEYDLERGERGSRHDHARAALVALTGAEDALVVNNNAAAVYLALAGLCVGREVIISRGQLVEIGGGFRIPDVLRQSGALLVEVGTTNRTHTRDFALAVTPQTAALMRVHSSNFRQVGFVAMPSLQELAAIAHAPGGGREPLVLIDDLGSGSLLDTRPFGLSAEPLVQESVAAGADLVTFSGDKLLGGPQAGIIVGRRDLVERLRRHPMARALRVDKLTFAALEITLRAYRRGRALEEIPVWRMIAAPLASIEARAQAWRARLAQVGIAASVVAGESAVGGGSLPGETLPTALLALAVDQPDGVAAALRVAPPGAVPVVARIQNDWLLLDPRTVLPDQDTALLDALGRVLGGVES